MLFSTTQDKALDAWSIPTLNLKEELLNPKEDFADKPYPILNPNFVFRNSKEIAELLQIYPNLTSREVVDLISFRPERLALHALIIETTLRLKASDELQLQGQIFQNYQQLQSDTYYQNLIKEIYTKRQTLEEHVTAIVNGSHDIDKIDPSTRENITKKINEFQHLIENQTIEFGKYKYNYTKEQALTALVTDNLYKELISPEIFTYIKGLIDRVIEITPELAIPIPNPNDRLTIMIAGGQASGKSIAWELLRDDLSYNHLKPEDFIKLNTDYFKPILLTPGTVNKYLFSQLAQPEATLMRRMVQARIEMLIAKNEAPYLSIDQVFLEREKLDFSLGGRGVLALIISAKVEQAIERAFNRGEMVGHNCGRFEHTAGMLAGHKGVATHFFADIFHYFNRNLTVSLLDNDLPLQDPPIEIMRLNLGRLIPEVHIYNIELLKNFMKKVTINTNAKNKNEVYPSDVENATMLFYQQFLHNLKELGCHLQIETDKATKVPSLFATQEKALQNQSSTQKTYHFISNSK